MNGLLVGINPEPFSLVSVVHRDGLLRDERSAKQGIEHSLSIAAVVLLKPSHDRSNDFACFQSSGPCLCVESIEFVDSLGEFLCVCELGLQYDFELHGCNDHRVRLLRVVLTH